jgi:hypothetical protein
MAMWPFFVSGYYFGNPEVSIWTWKIKEDQVIDYMPKKRFNEVAMKWLIKY